MPTFDLSLRPGGRSPAQLRPLTLTPGFVQTAEGSVLVALGNTRVLTCATVEQGVPGWLRNSGRGWVTAEYAMLPRSTVTRTPRESERGKIGGRTHEIQRLIGRSLRSVVDMQALGERTVILDCDVIQADGGTRTAAITGAAVALALALEALVKAGTLKPSPLKQLVAATSVGIVDGAALLDLCYEEDSQAEVDMNVVMTADGGLVETQATAEKGIFFARAAEWADRSGGGGAQGDLRRAAGGAGRQGVGVRDQGSGVRSQGKTKHGSARFATQTRSATQNCCIGRERGRIHSSETIRSSFHLGKENPDASQEEFGAARRGAAPTFA